MAKNLLIDALRKNDEAKGKKANGYFDTAKGAVCYSTGIPVLDYFVGYMTNVYDENDNIIDSYPSLGFSEGTIVTIIGKPSTAKTSSLMKYAANIVRPFDNGFILHWDLERSTLNYTRIQSLTNFSMSDIKNGKYILRKEKLSLDQMKAALYEIYEEKVNNKDKYMYDTGKKNEFGEEIYAFQPTVIILDSIGAITVGADGDDLDKMEEVSSQTDRMRLTAYISRFFNEIMDVLAGAGIMLFCVNQLKTAVAANSFVHQAADVMYLSPNESMPGGKGPVFAFSILMKHTMAGSGKLTLEDDGIEGNIITVTVIKSRQSSAGRTFDIVYDKNRGVSMLRTCIEYAKSKGLLGGNRAGYYFTNNKDHKFALRTCEDDFKNDKDLYKIMHDAIIPELEKNLTNIQPDDIIIPDDEINFYNL